MCVWAHATQSFLGKSKIEICIEVGKAKDMWVQ